MGVVFNRVNVVVLAMHLRGPMPQVAPEAYSPSIFEWGISVGLIAASVFLFGLGARLLPLLPKHPAVQGD
jgi:formate dehydrogenase iron-sulfur subunit